jgi:hypothetical protein
MTAIPAYSPYADQSPGDYAREQAEMAAERRRKQISDDIRDLLEQLLERTQAADREGGIFDGPLDPQRFAIENAFELFDIGDAS